MPHLIFIAKGRDVGMFRLTGLERRARPVSVGRDVECDIFVPDMFVSRTHCRLEPTDEGEWAVVDTRSRNGVHFNGHPVYRRILRHGDTIQVGSVAFQYDETDMPARLSSPAPFGAVESVALLAETIYTEGLTPGEWKKKNRKKPAWVRQQEEEEEARRAAEAAATREARELAERLNFSEPTELDLEVQIANARPDTSFGAHADLEVAEARLRLAEAQVFHARLEVEQLRDQLGLAPLPPTPSSAPPPAGNPFATTPAPAGGDAVGVGDLAALLPDPGAGAAPGAAPVAAAAPGAPAAAPVTAVQAAMRPNLWAEAASAAEAAQEAAREKKARPRKKKEPEAAAAPAAPRRTFGEWLQDVQDRLQFDAVLDMLRDNPMRSASVAAVLLVAVGTTVWFTSRPPRPKPIDLNSLTPAQRRNYLTATGN